MIENFNSDLEFYLDRNNNINYQALNIILLLLPLIILIITKNIFIIYIFIIVYLFIMYVSSIKLYNNIQLYNQLIYPLFQLLLFSMLYISYNNIIKKELS